MPAAPHPPRALRGQVVGQREPLLHTEQACMPRRVAPISHAAGEQAAQGFKRFHPAARHAGDGVVALQRPFDVQVHPVKQRQRRGKAGDSRRLPETMKTIAISACWISARDRFGLNCVANSAASAASSSTRCRARPLQRRAAFFCFESGVLAAALEHFTRQGDKGRRHAILQKPSGRKHYRWCAP